MQAGCMASSCVFPLGEMSSGQLTSGASARRAQESIRASRDWFLACAPHAGGMAARLAQALFAQPAYERQLHLIYLANDILLKRCARGHALLDLLPDYAIY